ncbi:MAG: M20 family metallo-hydrolase [Candidatus Tectomicrobia bacterium]|uniref:M20 family metallo-hydrolase n=1 Tax=Tectimicrobiota bacterium TaxID=2528274 RepID=A0A932HZQ2_UNCTE|nr:M20 family metallo-hydrolase [Candidatus Tectomicrobia bacterium]
MAASSPLRANRARMQREFDAQARIGRFGETGLVRIALTPEYNRARDLVRRWMEEAGLRTRVDAVGNLIGRREGRAKGLPAVMAGSHLDSQNPGGRFDGPAGVLAALEAVRRIAETGAPHDHPLEVVAFVGEESAGGMTVFGSSVMTGVVGPREMRRAVHPPTGKSMYEAVAASGGNPARAASCVLPKKALKAFIELHIEQGPVLEAERAPIGVVDRVVGYTRGKAIFEGVTAHSGGQPMPYRRDAAMAAADFMVEMERAVRRMPESQRVTLTFGEVDVRPGWISIVPGEAALTFDLRARGMPALKRMIGRMRRELARIRRERKVPGRLAEVSILPPCPTSPAVRRAIARAAEETGSRWISLASGGVHDACRMARVCPMGMIFIPSVKGLSHTPEEFTHFRHLVRGAEVLAAAMLRLADRRAKA